MLPAVVVALHGRASVTALLILAAIEHLEAVPVVLTVVATPVAVLLSHGTQDKPLLDEGHEAILDAVAKPVILGHLRGREPEPRLEVQHLNRDRSPVAALSGAAAWHGNYPPFAVALGDNEPPFRLRETRLERGTILAVWHCVPPR